MIEETYERDLTTVRARGSAKWSAYPEDVLCAPVAEMDYTTAPEVQEAILAAAQRELYGYPSPQMQTDVQQALSGWYRRVARFQVDPGRIHTLPDILKGMELGLQLFNKPGAAVVIPTPSYPPFFIVSKAVDLEVVEVPCRRTEKRWELDLEGIERAFRAGAGTLILCNPHNPLGRVFTPDEMASISAIVDRYQGRVIADEVHAPLTYPGHTWIPYASSSEVARNHTISLMSASKGWNLAGLKCAQVAVHSDADETAWGTLSPMAAHGASTLGMIGNTAALESGDRWLAETMRYLDENRTRFGELLRQELPEIEYRAPEGTYLTWLDCRALELDSPQKFFLEHARVALNDGDMFGGSAKGGVRLNLATSRPVLEEIVARMAKAVRAR
ncbi:MAG: MalY/PatB family protein [Candidatus Dormibacteraceae bacterium]